MKHLIILSLLSVLVLPLFAYAKPKPPQNLFEYLTNGDTTIKANCSLKGVAFNKKCSVESTYLGSTMGFALAVHFPNGKKADYRVDDYEKKTLFGLNDDNVSYYLTSTATKLDIYRNKQSWIKIWKAK